MDEKNPIPNEPVDNSFPLEIPPEHEKSENGGFVRNNEIPRIENPTNKRKIKTVTKILVGVLIAMIAVTMILAVDAFYPDYRQKSFPLSYDCIASLYWKKSVFFGEEFDKLNMVCPNDKFFNGEMFQQLGSEIEMVLVSQGINSTVNVSSGLEDPTPDLSFDKLFDET